jgi:hypothetical protein
VELEFEQYASYAQCVCALHASATQSKPSEPRHAYRLVFRALLAAGDKDVVYPLLKWVVSQPDGALEKRAFVGYYMSFPDVSGVSYVGAGVQGKALHANSCTCANGWECKTRLLFFPSLIAAGDEFKRA